MNMTDELATWISNGDVAVFFTDLNLQWPNSWRSEVWAGVRDVTALQVKCLRVYGVSVTFMSTGYMCHEYDLRTGDWMMILPLIRSRLWRFINLFTYLLWYQPATSPFNTNTYVCVYMCMSICGHLMWQKQFHWVNYDVAWFTQFNLAYLCKKLNFSYSSFISMFVEGMLVFTPFTSKCTHICMCVTCDCVLGERS